MRAGDTGRQRAGDGRPRQQRRAVRMLRITRNRGEGDEIRSIAGDVFRVRGDNQETVQRFRPVFVGRGDDHPRTQRHTVRFALKGDLLTKVTFLTAFGVPHALSGLVAEFLARLGIVLTPAVIFGDQRRIIGIGLRCAGHITLRGRVVIVVNRDRFRD
ncbi:hypothetical protein SRABI106_03837 [Rahnella aquatilis]|nr:hypothetical protein SRABI106_03837 [Rahnella aquatilis]